MAEAAKDRGGMLSGGRCKAHMAKSRGWGSWEVAVSAPPLPTTFRVWGSGVSSSSGVLGRAPADYAFLAF